MAIRERNPFPKSQVKAKRPTPDPMIPENPLPFSRSEIEGSIPDRFARIAEKYGERTAIWSESGEWNYSTLDHFSNQVAQSIAAQIGSNQQPVLLLFDHQPVAFASLLGVLKSGNWFVALDPEFPQSRCRLILRDLQAKLLITDTSHHSQAVSICQGSCEIINTDQLDPDRSALSSSIIVPPDAIEAVFYTSGSTGQPKGVVRTHRFILNRVWLETHDYRIQPEDKISLIHNYSYGSSQTDILNAFLNGARLDLFDIQKKGIDELIGWLKQQEITFFHIPSDLFRRFVDGLKEDDFFPRLRQITPSGRLYRVDVEKIRLHIPDECSIIQRLSSTETGMITRMVIERQTILRDNIIPAGHPVQGMEVFILDEMGEPLGNNEVGEIVVVSANLASGYWKQPELTSTSFIPSQDGSNRKMYRTGDLGRIRTDGMLELVGRKDEQVKIRGYRVELREVEAVLLSLAEVKEAVVVARASETGETRLVAYVVPTDGGRISINNLRKSLVESLPEYMIPAFFIRLEALPLTSRGRVDLTALPLPGKGRPELAEQYLAPRTWTERELSEIWSEALNILPIGVLDNFFELGGHSLIAAQIISKTNRIFKIDLPLRSLFDAPTIATFAAIIEIPSPDSTGRDMINLENALDLLGY